MKPKEKEPETVYQIYDKPTGASVEPMHTSVSAARNPHVNLRNKAEFGVAKYRVTYELIDGDEDPATIEEAEQHARNIIKEREIESEMDELGLNGWDRFNFRLNRFHEERVIAACLELSEE